MSDVEAEDSTTGLVLEFLLDAPVDKVWHAIEAPEIRAKWLPGCALTDPEHRVSRSGREVRFTLRDGAPPFVETTVTFLVRPAGEGGSILRIAHDVPVSEARGLVAANGNRPPLMRAA